MSGLTLQQLEDIAAPLFDAPQDITILIPGSKLEEAKEFFG